MQNQSGELVSEERYNWPSGAHQLVWATSIYRKRRTSIFSGRAFFQWGICFRARYQYQGLIALQSAGRRAALERPYLLQSLFAF